ncbi:protein translocase subunit SecD [Alteromonas pelagimontana]|uniref:Multifunctional fusion protein n=1 Tax=Alteromonas pelagimontana TaxID=1858656 RepID=A0A6M4MES2_9ALTE|nr:protein translocase subunit SecD [Alteromonas pelagimontana]QJR81095.1 protein translocase subunit SecD [Alteromonas pelagimontana]
MKFFNPRGVIYVLIIVLGLLCAMPNVLPAAAKQHLPFWYSNIHLSLGLDLQGGSHLLLAAQTEELFEKSDETIQNALLAQLRDNGIRYQRTQSAEDGIAVRISNVNQADKAVALAMALAQGPDGLRQYEVYREGDRLHLALTEIRKQQLTTDAIERSLEVVRRRLNETGLVEPSITRQGDDGVLVQMPGVTDPSHIRELLGTTAQMAFHWVVTDDARAGTIQVKGADETATYRLEKKVAMQGEHISDAQLAFDPNTGEPVVSFKLDSAGARQFGEMTRTHIGVPLAVVLDNTVITAPVIRSVIATGSGEISGAFTPSEAKDLALLLRAGALPVPLEVIEERTVGPDLGSDAIQMGLITGLIGAAMVFAFMGIIYRRWGLIACVGLSVNMGLVFAILSLFGATLTLPGIAGIILTVGMAVDANILITERIREETRLGKRSATAIKAGFDKAYTTILDSNLTTLIAVSLLFMFGSGPVKGFAVTIAVGLVTSLFTAVAVTRLLMEWTVRGREREYLKFNGFSRLDKISQRGVDFLRGRVIGLTASAILSVASVMLFLGSGLNYGVDFTGGTLVEVQAPALSVEQLRTTLTAHKIDDGAIQEFGNQGQYLVRLPVEAVSEKSKGHSVDALKQAVNDADPTATFPRVDMVGPKVSGGFADASILAILLAGAGIVAYLWIRFESHFALAATATIALDLTKTIGFFALTGLEFNLTAIAALLALIGYSINDKVVVFDRIREGFRATPDKPMLEILNSSISSTLTRTVFTSLTTFLALLPMGIAGGAAVASFALPMLFGVVIGTSSSIFIASPILYYLGQRRARKGLKQLRPTAQEIQQELAHIP